MGTKYHNEDIISQDEGSITFRVDSDLPKPTGFGLNMHNNDNLISSILAGCEVWDDERVVASGIGDNQYAGYGTHTFFKGLIEAFGDHRPMVLTPDVIWFLICRGFANYVNQNPELYRDLFVNHEGKIDLLVKTHEDLLNGNADWQAIVEEFEGEISRNTKRDIAKLISDRFSTTGVNEHIVSQIVLMESVKSYFNYKVMHIVCGIPCITLKGTVDDWRSILERSCKLRSYGIDWWIDELEPILAEFVKAAGGNPNIPFWRSIVMTYHPDAVRGPGCGLSPDATKFDGWFLKFLPFGKYNRTPDKVTMDYPMQPELVKTDYNYIEYDESTGEVKKKLMMEFWAGIVGMEVEPETFTMTPKLGWFSRIKKNEDELLAEFEKKDKMGFEGLELRLNKVPDVLGKMKYINHLDLEFTGKVVVPDWMDNKKIREFRINGELSRDEKMALWKRFPGAIIGYERMKIKNKFTIGAIKGFFEPLGDVPCPLTEKLVKAGYQQKSDGYIARAKREGVLVDYRRNSPSQYWHLMTYCDGKKNDDLFSKSVVCGELIFWMAEVSESVDPPRLEALVDEIIKNPIRMEDDRPIYDRKKWNIEIQRVCFDRICERFEIT